MLALSDSKSAKPTLSTGTIVGGRYRIIRFRGAGGMGEVYEAEHVVTGRLAALKTLSQEYAQDREARGRFAREARNLGRVNSRYVVGVLDAEVDGEMPFIVMELLRGRDARALLFRGPPASGPTHHPDLAEHLSLQEIGRFLLEVAKGLSALHDEGVVHRDLSPDNVFLERRDGVTTAKLIDLGISKRVVSGTSTASSDDFETRTGEVIGKPFYMAPAQLGGSKNVDPRDDIHAFAIVACQFFAGCREPSWSDPRLPNGLRAWFDRAMDNDFETIEEAARGLENVLASNAEAQPEISEEPAGEVSAPEPELVPVPSTSRRPRGIARYVALATSIVALAAGSWWWVRQPAFEKDDAVISAVGFVAPMSGIPSSSAMLPSLAGDWLNAGSPLAERSAAPAATARRIRERSRTVPAAPSAPSSTSVPAQRPVDPRIVREPWPAETVSSREVSTDDSR